MCFYQMPASNTQTAKCRIYEILLPASLPARTAPLWFLMQWKRCFQNVVVQSYIKL